jgi:hypothetical protein
MSRGTRGAYRKEDRVALPADLQKELVEKAAAKYGNCQELAKRLDIPKSSVHYYRIGRLTMPISVLDKLLRIADDDDLRQRIESRGVTKDRAWATEYAQDVFREMCRDKVRLPTTDDLTQNDDLRRMAACLVSYVLAEGSIWLQNGECGECAVNVTFASHETDLYNHFRRLCNKVFRYDIGPPQEPGNAAKAIRGFIYSRFIAEWFIENGVMPGYKSSRRLQLPSWIMQAKDEETWIAALQPWCDGEGSVCMRPGKVPNGFTISQSRHTDLDAIHLPFQYSTGMDRRIGKAMMGGIEVYGIPLTQYVSAMFRSEILEDVRVLFARLTAQPKISLERLCLKDDGFWSAIWTLRFGVVDTGTLFRRRLITQERKRRLLERRTAWPIFVC